MVRITVDTSEARKILKATAHRIRRSNFLNVARGAAKIARQHLTSASGPVRKYKKGRYHYFANKATGYKLKIRAGNLRKSMVIQRFKKSKLLWVGPKYLKGIKGKTIGLTIRTSSGFYDKMMMKKTGDDFIEATIQAKGSQIQKQLEADGRAWAKEIVRKANS